MKAKEHLTTKQMDFVQQVLHEHIDLASKGTCALWMNTLKQETQLTMDTMSIIKRKQKGDLNPEEGLSREHFWLLELALGDHCDLASEGVTNFVFTTGVEQAQTQSILNKVTRTFMKLGQDAIRLL